MAVIEACNMFLLADISMNLISSTIMRAPLTPLTILDSVVLVGDTLGCIAAEDGNLRNFRVPSVSLVSANVPGQVLYSDTLFLMPRILLWAVVKLGYTKFKIY